MSQIPWSSLQNTETLVPFTLSSIVIIIFFFWVLFWLFYQAKNNIDSLYEIVTEQITVPSSAGEGTKRITVTYKRIRKKEEVLKDKKWNWKEKKLFK
ncbi:hypothetical protein [Mycoplasma parvum]|uniref:Uncharacterized protein n=1 Tax=Mycoplasma parvum str. Indiana TaxID=1403316 RepID=U5NFX2_9MOLU|nr:hypothetical protein [Mycoplasma parvum]AGX89148.1 hypothetical protein PRV_02050 [Mycoplasma parvum str. Indiana]